MLSSPSIYKLLKEYRMPHLQFFVICTKAIVEKDSNALSLFNVLDALSVEYDEHKSVNAANPSRIDRSWNSVTQWIKESADEEATFEQRLEIIFPDGSTSGEAISELLFKQSAKVVCVTEGDNIPYIGPGVYLFRLSYRQSSSETNWQILSEYPMAISTNFGAQSKANSA